MKLFLLCVLAVGAFGASSRSYVYPRPTVDIVGGDDAYAGEFPYQISFQDTSYPWTFHFCGGSIYNNEWIITAAHCVDGFDFDNPQSLQIVAGDVILYGDSYNGQTLQVSKIIQHENYEEFKLANDIALLKLNGSLIFNRYVSAINLPAQGQNTTGDCVVTGWGWTVENGWNTSILQKVTVPVVSDAECQVGYYPNHIADSMICAGFAKGGKDACQGDSGGPMTSNGYLAGIVSWGYGCAEACRPGVYTEVSYFVDWIVATAV